MSEKKGLLEKEVTRRDFIKATGGVAAGAAVFGSFFSVQKVFAATGENTPDITSGTNVKFRLSVCQNCHSRCGIMGKVVDGVLVKIDGNPYHPNNMEEDERLTYATAVTTAYNTPGRLCPKGQAGVQVLYDPYRIKHPLKRVGARGSGKWQVISWNQAFTEIAAKINTLIPTANRLTTNIDNSVTELGKIASQLMFSPGRSTDGEIIDRIFKNTWGTINSRLDHTSICETSHHVGNKLMTWEGTKKDHFKPDIINCEYLILFGANYNEANFPMLALSRKLSEFKKVAGRTLVVVDPRMSNTAAKANTWLPAKPGTDAAVALAMVWRIMQKVINNDVDAQASITYLTNPNQAAATTDNEKTWTDSTWLVVVGKSATADAGITVGKYVRGSDLAAGYGIGANNKAVWNGATAIDASTAAAGILVPGQITLTSANGAGNVYCKTAFELLKEEIYDGKSVDYYASICGLDSSTLSSIADAFLLKGKKAVANAYRGSVQHTNGVPTIRAVMLLNMFVGNYDWIGGNAVGGGTWSYNTGMSGGSYSPAGCRVDRANVSATFYSTLVTNYPTKYAFPAQRPWGTYWLNGNYQEAFLGIATQYPYPCKVLITYWNAWPYSVPALKDVFTSTVTDESKIPLFVSISTTMGELEAYADYILPDTTYMEKWSFPGLTPTILTKATSYRQPLVGTFDGKAWDAAFDPNGTNAYAPIYPDTKMFEDILFGIAGALGFTTDIGGTALPANAWAHVKVGVTNLSTSSTKTVQDIIDKGGAFQDPGNAYTGNYLTGQYANIIQIYSEQLAIQVDSMGTAAAAAWSATTTTDAAWTNHMSDIKSYRFNPLAHYEQVRDVKNNPVTDLTYPFQLITYKSVLHGQARTIDLPWLVGIMPENFVVINSSDAGALDIKTYDLVRVSSPSNPTGIVGRARVTEGIRPGVVAISHHYGHWEHSSKPRYEDGTASGYDSTRSAGIQPNLIMRIDPSMGDISLQDKIGGSVSFYDTRVKVEKA